MEEEEVATGESASSAPTTQLELRIACKNLLDADVLSHSDPMVVLMTQDRQTKKWAEHGRTEWMRNTVDPEFTKTIPLEYRFEEAQRLRFIVYDLDDELATADRDYLGFLQCTLGEVVSAGTYSKKLTPQPGKPADRNLGIITVHAEEVMEEQDMVELRCEGVGLDKKDLFGKSDPFLEFSRKSTDEKFFTTFRTEVMKKTLNPQWPVFRVPSSKLTGKDTSAAIKVKCLDYDASGNHDLIGEFITSYNELTSAFAAEKELAWEVVNPKKLKKKKYTNSGVVKIVVQKVEKLYTFLEFIKGGCEINFTVGIDFTASNGNPLEPRSLHYTDPSKPNDYTQVLEAVGSVCQDYDTDKLFPAIGFGAKIGDEVSHDFPLNGNASDLCCEGIEGVVEAYHHALSTVQLWGPTNIAPIINHVAGLAEKVDQEISSGGATSQKYYVLLLLTDGVIADVLDTKRAIIAAACLPMSIIIVGVGGADFTAMEELDADGTRISVKDEMAERDIVQFVPFKRFKQAPDALAAAVLAEVPTQLVDYMHQRGIRPLLQ